MSIIKSLNLGLAFFLEIAMLAAFVYWGFHVNAGLIGRVLLGIGIPVLVIVAWTIWLAPTATQRLGMPWLVVLKAAIFGLASLALPQQQEDSCPGAYWCIYPQRNTCTHLEPRTTRLASGFMNHKGHHAP